MQKMELMLKMTDKDDIKNFVLPLVFKALEAPSEEIQVFLKTNLRLFGILWKGYDPFETPKGLIV